MPRGSDLSEGPNKKPSPQKAQQVQNKRQGPSTFQKARTKKPSAPKSNKYQTNVKNASTLSKEIQKLLILNEGKSAPSTKETRSPEGTKWKHPRKTERWMPERGETFFSSNSRHPSFNLTKIQRGSQPFEAKVFVERGRRFFPKTQNLRTLPRQWTNYLSKFHKKELKLPCRQRFARKGGTFFSKKTQP